MTKSTTAKKDADVETKDYVNIKTLLEHGLSYDQIKFITDWRKSIIEKVDKSSSYKEYIQHSKAKYLTDKKDLEIKDCLYKRGRLAESTRVISEDSIDYGYLPAYFVNQKDFLRSVWAYLAEHPETLELLKQGLKHFEAVQNMDNFAKGKTNGKLH